MAELLYRYRFVLVIALLVFAALLATEKGRLPLALRGLKRVLRKDLGGAAPVEPDPPGVSARKRLIAFVLVLAAFVIAIC